LFQSKLPAAKVYLIFVAATALFFSTFATLSSIYRFQIADLNPFQLILIGTVLELTVFLFEVPTGIVADLYSRRRSVIIGMLLIGLGFALEGALPIFAFMLMAQVIWGLGATFESGAVEAWISDETSEKEAAGLFLRATQISSLVSFVGIGLSVVLGSLYLGLPMIVGGIGYLLLAVFLIFKMPEEHFQPSRNVNHNLWQNISESFKAGLNVAKRKPQLYTLFIITAILGASSETFDRLNEAHLIADIGMPSLFSPAIWFGLISGGSSLIILLVIERVRNRVDTQSHLAVSRALLTINVLLTVAVIGFGLAENFALALVFYMSAVMLRSLNRPLFMAWLNQKLEPQTRATVMSMNAQMDALGQIAGGPLLGLIAKAYGMPLAFVLAGFILLPASWLYLRTRRS
jgi:DHA3 family tetracycline resistance protein-like MFS transporter